VALSIAPARAGFTERSRDAGLLCDGRSWGALAADVDGDGDPDILCGHHVEGAHFWRNDGGRFSREGIPQFLEGTADRHGFLIADLDGDGLPEILSSLGGQGGAGGAGGGTELWRGTGGGRFEEVPGAGGMTDPSGRGRAFAAADVDGDGDLDVMHAKGPSDRSPASLYRNDGGLRFVDIAPSVGLDETFGTVGALFVDYDDDGDPDLFAGGEEFLRPTRLWRNDGTAFRDVTEPLFGVLPVVAGADWGDFDNDGDPDLALCEGWRGVFDVWSLRGNELRFYVNQLLDDDGVDEIRFRASGRVFAELERSGSPARGRVFLGPERREPTTDRIELDASLTGEPVWSPETDDGLFCWRDPSDETWRIRITAPPPTAGNTTGLIVAEGGILAAGDSLLEREEHPPCRVDVYRNDGGAFHDVGAQLGLRPARNGRAVQWVDFDNDGDLDLHAVLAGTVAEGNEPDVLWRNDGDRFEGLEGSGWVPGEPHSLADGGIWADFDGDGDPDLYLREGAGPLHFSGAAPARYYRNDVSAGAWLRIVPEAASGRTAVGARVTAHVGGRAVHRRLAADAWRGFHGATDLHFGLGSAAAVDSLVIVWPGGTRQVTCPLPCGRVFRVPEGQAPEAAE
jgi:hypothetical protein